jgi:ADP-ribose pyrophosphatase YjhB (NUDIX family)
MKIILRIIVLMRKIYWKIIKPTTIGIRAIIENQENQILLVKHNYASQWYLPGGKLKKGEDLLKGLERELIQEIGMSNFKVSRLLGTYLNNYESKFDYISVFVIKEFSISAKKHFEIEKITYFDNNNLPKNISPGTKRRINEYLGNKEINYIW